MGALDQPYVLDRKKCLSNSLQVEELPEEARVIMGNRVADCEICQEACPWNKKHLGNPLDTAMTKKFQRQMKAWEEFFYLPHLAELSEKEYIETLGRLNTGIPYEFFHRNVLIALENEKRGRKGRQTNP